MIYESRSGLLICPVRPGERNEELRYALRSWETHLDLPNHLRLWTVGFCPSWLEPDRHIVGNLYESAPLNVFYNILLASEAAALDGETDVVYMNDDFFCLDPVGSILPVRRDITLAQHIAMFPTNASNWWPKSLRTTAETLRVQGIVDPWSYEVHRPLPAEPEAMLTALQDAEWDSTAPPQWRTLYGAHNMPEAHPVEDVKTLGSRTVGFGTPWLSTSDETWRRHAVKMRKRFQKQSRWEID